MPRKNEMPVDNDIEDYNDKYDEYDDDYNDNIFDEDDDDKYDGGFPPTPPPAPGEHGCRQVGSCPRLCPTNTRRASLEAARNITPLPTIQRARGVASTTPPAPHNCAPYDRDGHHTGVEASSPPSPTVHDRPDRGGHARTRAHRRATRPADAGPKVEAMPLVPPTTITRGNTGFCSLPPDSSRGTMAPSQASTALPMETTPLPIHPRPANTLRKIVDDDFDEMFGDITNCPADDTRFWLRAIF